MSQQEGMSLEDRRAAVRAALTAGDPESTLEVVETHEDHVIVRDWEKEPQRYFRVDYSIADDGSVVLGDRVEVEVTYVPTSTPGAAQEGGQPAGDGQLEEFREVTRLKEASGDAEGRVWRVTLIQPGWSENNRYYPREVLAGVGPLTEGARAYADHPTDTEDRERPERSVHDLIGFYSSARQEADGRVTADLHLLESAAWLRAILREAPSLVGISINAVGTTKAGTQEGRTGAVVDSIRRLRSFDVVTEAAAGGRVERLVASNRTERGVESMEWKDVTLEGLRQHRPDLVKGLREAALAEARPEVDKALSELKEALGKAGQENGELRGRVVVLEARDLVNQTLAGSNLPDPARARVRQVIETSVPTKDGALDRDTLAKRLTEAIQGEQDYIKAISGSVVKGAGATDSQAGAGVTEAVKSAEGAMDNLFGVKPDLGADATK